jgi:Bacterial PH domain/Short C-terminal domain
MSFPRHLLGEDEELVLDLRPHWSAVTGPVLLGLVAIGAGLTLPGLVPGELGFLQATVQLVLRLAALTALGWLVAPRIARWVTTQIVLTSDRLILRTGVFTKYAREVRLPLIQDIMIRQSLWARLVRSGDLVVETAGQRRATFPSVPDPAMVRDEIAAQLDRYDLDEVEPPEPGEPVPVGGSVVEQLQHLAELRDRGDLSREEFQRLKSELLKRL